MSAPWRAINQMIKRYHTLDGKLNINVMLKETSLRENEMTYLLNATNPYYNTVKYCDLAYL